MKLRVQALSTRPPRPKPSMRFGSQQRHYLGELLHHGQGDQSTPLAFAAAIGPPMLKERLGLDANGWMRSARLGGPKAGSPINLLLDGMLRSAGPNIWNLYRTEGALGGLTRPPFTPWDPLTGEHLSGASLFDASPLVMCCRCAPHGCIICVVFLSLCKSVFSV
jgi:hypothetical protein